MSGADDLLSLVMPGIHISPSVKGNNQGYGYNGKTVHIYAIRCDKFIKIGVAADVTRRLRSMQGGNPRPMEIIDSFPIETKMASIIEHAAALALNDKHHMGEWFRCTKQEALFAITRAIQQCSDIKPAKPKTGFFAGSLVSTPHGKFRSAISAGSVIGIPAASVRYRLKSDLHCWREWMYAW